MKRLLRSTITIISGVGLSGAVLSKFLYDYSQKQGQNTNGSAVEDDNVDTDDETMTLKSVQVFFRHGARTPLSHLPNVEEVKYICIA